MGLLVRFPLERARALPPVANEGESASILVLPVIQVERADKPLKQESKARQRSGGKPRRRTKRPA